MLIFKYEYFVLFKTHHLWAEGITFQFITFLSPKMTSLTSWQLQQLLRHDSHSPVEKQIIKVLLLWAEEMEWWSLDELAVLFASLLTLNIKFQICHNCVKGNLFVGYLGPWFGGEPWWRIFWGRFNRFACRRQIE